MGENAESEAGVSPASCERKRQRGREWDGEREWGIRFPPQAPGRRTNEWASAGRPGRPTEWKRKHFRWVCYSDCSTWWITGVNKTVLRLCFRIWKKSLQALQYCLNSRVSWGGLYYSADPLLWGFDRSYESMLDNLLWITNSTSTSLHSPILGCFRPSSIWLTQNRFYLVLKRTIRHLTTLEPPFWVWYTTIKKPIIIYNMVIFLIQGVHVHSS